MISRLKGIVLERGSQSLVLDVQGVGYQVFVPHELLYPMQETVDIQIYYHWNAENGPQLYGFKNIFTRTVFTHILSCSGCGPKIGLAVLAHMSADSFVQAVLLADTKALSAVSGIGQKKAELMITQLKDKVAKLMPYATLDDQSSLAKVKQLTAALDALNYTTFEINQVLEQLKLQEDFKERSFDSLLRSSLSQLAKRL